MATGTIKNVVANRGFGFIRSDDDKDYFFHMSALPNGGFNACEVGSKVEFNPTQGKKGLRAENVQLIS
jgi:CspA family cold shock protein